MFLKTNDIRNDSYVTDIVAQDYRTSDIFRKYGIDFCCGGKLPLQTACEMRGLDVELIKKELYNSLRNIHLSNSTNFKDWSIDFLVDYIVNVHHSYLMINLPETAKTVEHFVAGHKSKYPWLGELLESLYKLQEEILPHLEEEEKVIFPYIKQIAHAYESRESYAALLVRTLRKPVENMMNHEHEHIGKYLHRFRELTNNYTPVPGACITHKVAFEKLKELDNDLVQHIHLENNILFPKAIAMEKELLNKKN
jgi:regulator of cell morphogenesis and NO signaling